MTKVVILDMQPIDPPTGGGRLRLLGLYHALGEAIDARYVGTYDWSGPGFRRQHLTPTLEEVLVPLSPAHFAAAKTLSKAVGGKPVIDSAFPAQAHLSPDYVAAARDAAMKADIVIFSHPWIYPLVRDALDPARQLIVYDSHNVEGLLRLELLDDGGEGSRIARCVAETEAALARAAHLMLACSQEDRLAFARLYEMPVNRIRVVPNGTFTQRLMPPNPAEKAAARKALGLKDMPVTLFIGSNYGPNVEAARFIAQVLAPALPQVLFVIAGGVGDGLGGVPRNVCKTGFVSEDEKLAWLRAADMAVNPMFGGSGTNIKMFDFMAAGLPIVSTEIGARGIEAAYDSLALAGREDFAKRMAALLADPQKAQSLGRAARARAEQSYSWERISANLGRLLTRGARRTAVYFSVIVPTYHRPESLTRLVAQIAAQTWRDFELIIVDQSPEPWPDRGRDFGIDICYVRSDLPGAVHARNLGADLASGEILAFIDDDCEPVPGWLAEAREEFTTRDIVGLEGLITSDRKDDAEWRAVTNDGFRGIAFMTANLFMRTAIFRCLNGFDVAFDHPHFREDTDLGWRAQALGTLPFSRAARVHHPPQPRSLARESLLARSEFFVKDALLLHKHPDRYLQLMRRERQWKKNPHYWTFLLKGVTQYQVPLPRRIRALIPARLRPPEPEKNPLETGI